MTLTLLITVTALLGAVFAGALLPPARIAPRICGTSLSLPR